MGLRICFPVSLPGAAEAAGAAVPREGRPPNDRPVKASFTDEETEAQRPNTRPMGAEPVKGWGPGSRLVTSGHRLHPREAWRPLPHAPPPLPGPPQPLTRNVGA